MESEYLGLWTNMEAFLCAKYSHELICLCVGVCVDEVRGNKT